MNRASRLLAILLVLVGGIHAWAISYTVQVVALSDREAALGVQATLLAAEYPAYVVRANTVQGDVFRVRVGAFANRAAALAFAEAMPPVAGSPPLPALAEGIPPGVMPLEPRLLARFEAAAGDVIEWGDGVALREIGDPARQGVFRLFEGDEPVAFEAWRAAPTAGGVLRLTTLPLWPPTWQDDAPEAREAYRNARLEALASRLGVDADRLAGLQGRPVFGPPFLVVLELFDPGSPAEGAVLGVVSPGDVPPASGTVELAVGEGEVPAESQVLLDGSAAARDPAAAVEGPGWTASASGEFFMLATEESRPWRAGVGEPLWGSGDHLITRSGDRLLLWEFLER